MKTVRDLNPEMIEATSRYVDWSATHSEDHDAWHVIEPRSVEGAREGDPEAEKWAKSEGYDNPRSWADHWYETNEPMMSYAWPLPGSRYGADEAETLERARVPLVIVEWGEGSGRDGHALALTGGGMDLSWEIARAYVLLGFLPPACLTLPRMADRWSKEHEETARAMRASYSVLAKWMRSRLVDLRHTIKSMKESR